MNDCILRISHGSQGTWNTGDTVQFTVVVSDPDRVDAPLDAVSVGGSGFTLVDPTFVELKLLSPQGVVQSYSLADGGVVRDSVGHYHATATLVDPSIWHYQFFISGYQGSDEWQLTVLGSAFDMPVNLSAPVLTGSVELGGTLSVTTGSWSNTPTSYTYQWLRDDVPIVGETSNTHVIVALDNGHVITCQVTATNDSGSSGAESNPLTGTASAPANVVAPVVSGNPVIGATIATTTGTWTGSATITFAYQWTRNGTPIVGATGSSYLLVLADNGTSVLCAVTASNTIGSVAVNSNALAIGAPLPINTLAPQVTGNTIPGVTLTSTTGTWTGNGSITYAYQWRRCDAVGASCADIVGATASTYLLSEADIDFTIRCAVTATDSFGPSTASSAPTAAVHFSSQNLLIPALAGSLTNTNWNTFTQGASAYFGGIVYSTGAQNAAISFNFYAEEGLYTVDLLHLTYIDRGVYRIAIDGVTLLTELDGYGVGNVAARATITNVAISTTGTHTMLLTMATKNPSATGYLGAVSGIGLTRAGA